MGAEIVCLERPGEVRPEPADITRRGRCFVPVDLRSADGLATASALIDQADALLEGFRPGVMERLGLGPEACLSRNPRLIYGRMTGWGQEGPLSRAAGHDINYIALCGALHAIGRHGERPVPPLNLVGDYGGGALYLAFGVVSALHERAGSGLGQVIDAAMVDGVAGLMGPCMGMQERGRWTEERGTNLLDGGAPWYDTYETSDGGYVGVGALEPKFWQELLQILCISPDEFPPRDDRRGWPAIRTRLSTVFRLETRDHWTRLFEGSDACVSPVLSLSEAATHPHHQHRATYVVVDERKQPSPAPRFSRTPGAIRSATYPDLAGMSDLLRRWRMANAPVTAIETTGVREQGSRG